MRRIQPKSITSIKEGEPLIPAAPGKPVEELVIGLQKNLVELVKLFELSPGIMLSDRVKLGNIVKEYNELVEENLGAAPNEDIKPEEPKSHDQLSMEAGIAEVIPAL